MNFRSQILQQSPRESSLDSGKGLVFFKQSSQNTKAQNWQFFPFLNILLQQVHVLLDFRSLVVARERKKIAS